MKSNTPKTISFKDLYLSSFLKAKNFTLHDASLDGQGRTVFYFEETPELAEAMQQFYQGTALVNPSSFIESFKNLRTLAYSLSGNLAQKKYGDNKNELSFNTR